MENEKGLDFPDNGKRKMENGKSSNNGQKKHLKKHSITEISHGESIKYIF